MMNTRVSSSKASLGFLMKRRVGLLTALTTIIILSTVYNGLALVDVIHTAFLPFAIHAGNSKTAAIVPLPGIALPQGLHANDQLDLAAQPFGTRVLIAQETWLLGASLVPNHVYPFVVQHGSARTSVPIRAMRISAPSAFGLTLWIGAFWNLFGAAIALVTVWRGRNLAATGLALFAVAELFAGTLQVTPSSGIAGLGSLIGMSTLILLMRVGLYIVAESMAGTALGQRARRAWRAVFLLVLGAGAIIVLAAPLAYVAAAGWGWAAFMPRSFGLILSASYLVPVALLFVGYQHSEGADRVRLGWMLWGGGLVAAGILIHDTGFLQGAAALTGDLALVLGLAVFMYAILRHRVVDVKVVISRTLVYAMTTSLVLGLFALFESLVERSALGHRASLMLELAVPLGLGISLSTVHRRIDTLVDRFIFRRQYGEAVALRRLANESAFVNHPEALLNLTVEQILRHVGAPWVAFYEYGSEGYRRVRQSGERSLPDSVATDDLVLVRLRAHGSDVDLHEAPSAFGGEGYVFPLRARDHLLGVLVVGPRPGEHYAVEEREMMAQVAHAVGASLFALRAQDTEHELSAAHAKLETSRAQLEQVRAEAAEQIDRANARWRASEARESKLLDALRKPGVDPKVLTEG